MSYVDVVINEDLELWLNYLKANSQALDSCLAWLEHKKTLALDEMRQAVSEGDIIKAAEKEGTIKTLDSIISFCTMADKENQALEEHRVLAGQSS